MTIVTLISAGISIPILNTGYAANQSSTTNPIPPRFYVQAQGAPVIGCHVDLSDKSLYLLDLLPGDQG